MSTTAVVILNWNGKSFLEKFLPALVAHTSLPGVELVVADNGSTDGSHEFLQVNFPQIRWIGLDKNYGFTGGYNRALQQIHTDYYVLLNSDVEVTEDWLQTLIDAMDSYPNVGACMPKIRAYDRRNYFEYAGASGGFIDKYGFPFCRGRILNCVEEDCGQYDTPREIFWASGACMVVRANLYHQQGGLDEDFFAHMEEIDFCWRVKQLGYKVMCYPQSIVYHVGGGTLSNNSPHKLFLNYRNSLYLLYKNLPNGTRPITIFTRMVIDGISAIIYVLQGKFSSVAAVWKAHIAFWKTRKIMREKRSMNRNNRVPGIYRRSIVVDFYLSKKKRVFSNIRFTK